MRYTIIVMIITYQNKVAKTKLDQKQAKNTNFFLKFQKIFGNLLNAETFKTTVTKIKKIYFQAELALEKNAALLAIQAYVFFFLNLNLCHKKLKKLQEETCAGMKDNTMKPMCLPSLPVSNIYFLTYYQSNVKTIILKNLLILKFL